jgi:hypothetical protein
MKIPKSIEEKIKNVDLLTDFDGTMIKEESEYIELLMLFFTQHKNHFNFLKDLFIEYCDYRKTKDVRGFYALFKYCPVKTFDKIANLVTINNQWKKSIEEELKPKEVGILSRNNQRIISGCLENFNYPNAKISLVAANNPKVENGFYTGEVDVSVDNYNLADFMDGKGYICGDEEKRILEKSEGIHCERLKSGLYICRRKKIF